MIMMVVATVITVMPTVKLRPFLPQTTTITITTMMET
jgi:hypothetical protein